MAWQTAVPHDGQSRGGYPQRWVPATLRVANFRSKTAGVHPPDCGSPSAGQTPRCAAAASSKTPALLTKRPLDRDSHLGPLWCGFPSAWVPNAEWIPRTKRPRRDSRSSGRERTLGRAEFNKGGRVRRPHCVLNGDSPGGGFGGTMGIRCKHEGSVSCRRQREIS